MKLPLRPPGDRMKSMPRWPRRSWTLSHTWSNSRVTPSVVIHYNATWLHIDRSWPWSTSSFQVRDLGRTFRWLCSVQFSATGRIRWGHLRSAQKWGKSFVGRLTLRGSCYWEIQEVVRKKYDGEFYHYTRSRAFTIHANYWCLNGKDWNPEYTGRQNTGNR